MTSPGGGKAVDVWCMDPTNDSNMESLHVDKVKFTNTFSLFTNISVCLLRNISIYMCITNI